MPVPCPPWADRTTSPAQWVTTVDRSTLDAGETATLTVTLAGKGALRSEKLHLVVPEDIRTYEEQPEVVSALKAGAVRSRAVYRTTLVPLRPGSYTIPPVNFSFFEPGAGSYRSVLSEPIALEVLGTAVTDPAVIARSASLGRAKEEVEILGVDILPLHRGAEELGNAHLNPQAPWFLALLGLPLLGVLGLASLAQRERLADTTEGQKRQRRSAGRASIKVARKAAHDDELEAGEAALKHYLVSRLGAQGATLGPEDGASVLSAEGAPDEVANQLTQLLRRAEGVRYGGAAETGLAAAIAEWMERCEREWR